MKAEIKQKLSNIYRPYSEHENVSKNMNIDHKLFFLLMNYFILF